jgi:hypothetical protein
MNILLADNQALNAYAAGIIQMVPGRAGYEPAYRGDDFQEAGFKQTSREARHQRPRQLDEKYETTYTENRRMASFGTSDLGSFVDTYA